MSIITIHFEHYCNSIYVTYLEHTKQLHNLELLEFFRVEHFVETWINLLSSRFVNQIKRIFENYTSQIYPQNLFRNSSKKLKFDK